jgi:hypothetical protein
VVDQKRSQPEIGMRFDRAVIWPWAILVSTLAAGIVSLVSAPATLRAPIVLLFTATCPGLSLVRLLRLSDWLVEVVLAVALSLSLDGIIAAIFLYAGHWSPAATMVVLIAISLFPLAVEAGWRRLAARRSVTQ